MSSSLRVNTIVPSTGTNVAIGTANGTVTFTDSVNFVLGTGSSIFSPASNTLTFGTNDAERLRIDSAGSVIIGDSDTDNANAIANDFVVGNTSQRSGITIVSGSGDDGSIFFSDGTGSAALKGQIVYNQTADAMRFYTANAQRIGITSTGRIGINNTSPGAMLQVDYDEGSSEVGLRLRAYNASGSKTWQLSEVNGNAGVFTIRNATNAQNILSIDGVNQRVGVNNTSPSVNLHVKGSASNGQIYLGGTGAHSQIYADNDGVLILNADQGNSAANSYLGFNVDNTERLRIDSSGDVHIGDSSSNANGHGLLSLTQNASAAFNALVIQQGNTAFTATDGLQNGIDAGVHAYIKQYENRDIYFTTGNPNSEKLRLYSNGKLHLGNSHIDSNNLTRFHVGWNTGGTVAGESIIAGTLGNGTTAVSALLTMKNAGNRGAQGASSGSSLAKFEFNNGTAFEIDKYGRRTLQYQPGCKISIDANGQGGGNHAQTGITIVPFNSTSYGYNTGNHYNLTTHTFTAPLDGRYLVILSINVIGDNIAYIYKNGSVHSGGEFRSNPNGTWEHMEISAVVDCSANDTIQPYSNMTGSGRKFNGGSGGSIWDTLSIYYLG